MFSQNDSRTEQDIQILEGNAVVEAKDDASFFWIERGNRLDFEKAYRIRHKNCDTGIRGCTYAVCGRTFTDASFASGDIVMEMDHKENQSDIYQLRTYPDGGEFIVCGRLKPCFDSGDYEWDSRETFVVYVDEKGVNLAHCSQGYKIPQIDIYIGLREAYSGFQKVMECLRCPDFGIYFGKQ